MKMTIREAIEYILKADGMPYTDELDTKIHNFFKKLPRNPKLSHYREWCVVDYAEGWYATIKLRKNGDKLSIKLIDGDNLDPSDTRVKCNQEALKLIEDMGKIVHPTDVDPYWDMSDDHRYWRQMSAMRDKAYREEQEILEKLI